ncbi:DUF3343 domain-containing protein [Candidatus Enterococcus ikei]|uniref:DUF3343 domain-containing protein n=1 Tax=Candidatus Enterococcus ikei TaxID=2815326 RepID=A0ABS3GWB7_9ENTE|nr:DUF3343 domain-containing protein [Enterococcus sp. DIV0869a]MBO0439562.1 DUF3343 domain-containing protein [Enterococcus sp. DIV0869a]
MDYLLTFQNTHYAIHGEKTLMNTNISVSVMALPTSLGDFCGICLRLAAQDLAVGCECLKAENVPIEAIFKIESRNNERTYTPCLL